MIKKKARLFRETQMSPDPNRTLPYCNEDELIPDVTKDYEVRRERDTYDEEVELDQVGDPASY